MSPALTGALRRAEMAPGLPARSRPAAVRGFTLIDVLIAAVIVGLLAAIALPAYSNYLLRAHRSLGTSRLLEISAQQETFLADRKQYATVLGPDGLGYAGDTLYLTRGGQVTADASSEAIYRITLAAYSAATTANCAASGAATGTAFIVVAEPRGAQARDRACGTLCLAQDGTRGQSGIARNCWRG